MVESGQPTLTMNRRGRMLVLAAAFLGWMFAGWEMNLLPLAARAATIGLLQERNSNSDAISATDPPEPTATADVEKQVVKWFTRYIVAFLLGAAAGGWIFGWLGDHSGRVRAMGISIICYSVFTGLSYFVTTPFQMCVLRFVACMGIGGMWPTGVALVSEAWEDVSRPTLAGLIGTSANVGIALLGIVVKQIGTAWPEYQLTPDSWRWIMLAGAIPVVLGCWVLAVVPESTRWLAVRQKAARRSAPLADILRPPLLNATLSGIALGTIPLLGAWGSQKWILPWAGAVGTKIGVQSLESDTQTWWAIGAAIGSLCGGWLATMFGRKSTYFAVSLFSLILSQLIFRFLDPSQGWGFLLPVFLLGLISTVYFGWLPLFLPELFPTRVRATGSGVSFNSGRIVSAVVILSTVGLVGKMGGDYGRIGSLTSWVYVAGMVVILLVPTTSQSLDDLDAADRISDSSADSDRPN